MVDIKLEAMRALANKFSSKIGDRNPNWDWEKPDAEDNQLYFTRAEEKQLKDSPWITYLDADGFNSLRVASYEEIIDTLIEANIIGGVVDDK